MQRGSDLVVSVARHLVRLGTRLRKRVTRNMNLSEYLAEFGTVMDEAKHDSSWGVAGCTCTDNGTAREGSIFVFVSVRPDRVKQAQALLGAAGLLCETPLRREGEEPVTETLPVLAVHGLTVGLRALMGGPR